MSRVGNKPIPVPKGVKIAVGEQLEIQGPKGKLAVPIPRGIEVRQADGRIEIARRSDDKAALHGLTRALAANAVRGVSTGFTRELDIVGIGYRCDVKGKVAILIDNGDLRRSNSQITSSIYQFEYLLSHPYRLPDNSNYKYFSGYYQVGRTFCEHWRYPQTIYNRPVADLQQFFCN